MFIIKQIKSYLKKSNFVILWSCHFLTSASIQNSNNKRPFLLHISLNHVTMFFRRGVGSGPFTTIFCPYQKRLSFQPKISILDNEKNIHICVVVQFSNQFHFLKLVYFFWNWVYFSKSTVFAFLTITNDMNIFSNLNYILFPLSLSFFFIHFSVFLTFYFSRLK